MNMASNALRMPKLFVVFPSAWTIYCATKSKGVFSISTITSRYVFSSFTIFIASNSSFYQIPIFIYFFLVLLDSHTQSSNITRVWEIRTISSSFLLGILFFPFILGLTNERTQKKKKLLDQTQSGFSNRCDIFPDQIQSSQTGSSQGFQSTQKIPDYTQFGQTGSSRVIFFFSLYFFYILLLILISNFVLLICRWMSKQLQKHKLIHQNTLNDMMPPR